MPERDLMAALGGQEQEMEPETGGAMVPETSSVKGELERLMGPGGAEDFLQQMIESEEVDWQEVGHWISTRGDVEVPIEEAVAAAEELMSMWQESIEAEQELAAQQAPPMEMMAGGMPPQMPGGMPQAPGPMPGPMPGAGPSGPPPDIIQALMGGRR